MKKLKSMKKIVAVILIATFVLSSSILSLAVSADVYIPANQAWTSDSDNTDSRSGNYSTVYARCHTVYPDSGTDSFSKIQVQVTNGYGVNVSNVYILSETASSSTEIPIKEGYLGIRFVGFKFRGNSSSDANSSVSYNGR